MSANLKIGVVGATGLVGETFLQLLQESQIVPRELRLFASEKSAGSKCRFGNQTIPVNTLEPQCFQGLDLVFFSSGEDISKHWAPEAVAAGAYAIDNSAAFRMDSKIPLVVPAVNSHRLPRQASIIANPNCSTIQLVHVLAPLQKKFTIQSVQVATYQAVSGAGRAAREELIAQLRAWLESYDQKQDELTLVARELPHPIAMNCLPQIGNFQDNGFCSEELKISRETQKILECPDLPVSAFTVRIPAWNAHSEAVWLRLAEDISRDQFIATLSQAPDLCLVDNTIKNQYPHALVADKTNPVYVGRIHRDLSDPKLWLLWIVADNLRIGAALNGLQIAERLFDISTCHSA